LATGPEAVDDRASTGDPADPGDLSIEDEETLARRDALDVFLVGLEQRMLDGHSIKANRVWAATEHCVHMGAFDRCVALVRESWAVSNKTIADATAERDEICARYLNVYRSALAKGKHEAAIKALDSIARIRNLDQTPTMNINVGGQITNASRETVAVLLARAREITESRTLRRLQSIADDQVGADKPVLDVLPVAAGGGKR
jgi:hypothetical protein